ncbi:hypothetical protein EKK58_08710 [Candidatus Dependentiae bacterium]|nr:MAG: hypothetical protein EKK58_08710 [Candidatus Dependentiae bacterium]
MSEYKKRVQAALEKYYEKQENKDSVTQRRNKKPEEITVRSCMAWMRGNGFDVNIVESKSVFNPNIGRYMNSQTRPGVLDCFGNDPFGVAVYVEFKALGKRHTLRPNQRDFIEKKIKTHCFAVVVDSQECLQKFYEHWRTLDSEAARQQYLFSILPKERNQNPLSDDDFFGA